ncbi:MAG: hypothetical protein HWN68_14560 [Desulfobacterales bacterium]|nr:hypothetical protein [Desulfobacterales bacterium]
MRDRVMEGAGPFLGPYPPKTGLIPGEALLHRGGARIAAPPERIAGIWETISGWLNTIVTWVGPLGELLDLLEQYGIITPTEREGAEGLTREEVARMIEEKYAIAAPSWQKYLPWVVAGGLGVGLIAVLLARRKPVYVVEK